MLVKFMSHKLPEKVKQEYHERQDGKVLISSGFEPMPLSMLATIVL